MNTEHKRELIRLIEKERIQFHGPDHCRPGNHAPVFSALHKLSRYKFDQYVHNFTYEAHQKPWRAKIKQQVERVVRLAEDCRYARQNEFGWRLKLESEILARFSTEVTCKRCSSKLWRSEVEVLLNPLDTFRDMLDLKKRQANRKPCSCSEMQRCLDRNDPGICRIFHDRADQPVKYSKDDPISKALPREQKPDRVYGFRKTSRFSRLLDEEILGPQFEGRELRDILECSPFNEMRDQVLFPFLVLEAKSETGDSFDDIEIQTALVIKKLLDIQFKLQLATGKRSQWRSGPLVWFLSSRGDDWRVAAACVEMHDNRTRYDVYNLWIGSIISKDAALQLLLIMDYIFDWARDFQREAVLNELRILAGRKAASIADDSEILSLGDHMQRFLDTDLAQRLMEERPDPQDPSMQHDALYRWLDSEHCVFRSTCWAHARVSALYITRENLKTLLKSFASNSVSRKHARDLLRLFREAWKVTPDALEALEFMWTGTQREDPDLYGTTQSFCAVFTVAAYFLSDWEQVSELTYIAIAENALDDLKAYVDPQQPIHVYPSELPQVQQEHLVGYFRHFRQSSARSRLHAAMRRRCLSSRLARESDFPDNFFLVAEEPFERGVRYRLDVTMLPDQRPKTRQLVAAVYNQCKRGMREPEEPFLRMSGIYDNTPWDHQDTPSVWDLDDLPIHEGVLYILLGSDKVANNGHTDFCIFVMDDIPAPQAFPLTFDLLESYFVVQTSQQENLSGSRIEWNVTFLAESISSNAAMFQQLKTQFRDLVIYRKNQLTSDTITKNTKRSTYHATAELPPHMRSKLKTPQGHWVMTTNPSDTYEDFRTATDHLVARKHNVKLITCLYAQPLVAGRAGLRSEQRQDRSREEYPNIIDKIRERNQGWKPGPDDFKIRNIMQRGDVLRLRNPYLKRRRDGDFDDKDREQMAGAGDWLTDQELDANIRAGNFDGDRLPVYRRIESTSKRLRWEKLDFPAEGPTIPKKSSQEETEVLTGDHVTDEELEALLEAGYLGEI
ncbi:uncharacterized protein Z518_00445 [Rhinocladiella mackenziei CBS 650.93]|uniref:Uncharacterized protein n=1 Tax=Rhinocladiella mackenziei CBS 650.93 TaxID=1442369 RepID=A0A0D2J0Z4_9EURO|nr:uncharacterized protein Z518_00445 [Rhinocladiella mackenziei CBS 650.93]KIX09366.1 hypothetical protein Z518_00445 [Rhinocladiella mackenziei CBS 650.93]